MRGICICFTDNITNLTQVGYIGYSKTILQYMKKLHKVPFHLLSQKASFRSLHQSNVHLRCFIYLAGRKIYDMAGLNKITVENGFVIYDGKLTLSRLFKNITVFQ